MQDAKAILMTSDENNNFFPHSPQHSPLNRRNYFAFSYKMESIALLVNILISHLLSDWWDY